MERSETNDRGRFDVEVNEFFAKEDLPVTPHGQCCPCAACQATRLRERANAFLVGMGVAAGVVLLCVLLLIALHR